MEVGWILTIIGCLCYIQPNSAELKLLQAVFRHGNRAPTEAFSIYPRDPYVNETYYPVGIGGLTNYGKMSSYKLGQFFRERYGKFLGPVYSKDIIRFRADEIDRIVMTGQLVAAGLFPPSKIQDWNPELPWMPIPVWAPPLSTDILYNGIFCTNYQKWREHIEKSDKFVRKQIESRKELFDYMSYHTGSNITHFKAFFIRQQLYAQRDIGLKLPEWTESIFPDVLDEVAVTDLLFQSYTEKMKQVLGGVWIAEWLGHVDSYLSKISTRKQKAYMYPAHELNIVPIQIALDDFDHQIPSYSSAIMFELHEIDNELYVQVLHRQHEKLRTLILPECGVEMCPLQHFRKIVAPLVPEDSRELCGNLDFLIF